MPVCNSRNVIILGFKSPNPSAALFLLVDIIFNRQAVLICSVTLFFMCCLDEALENPIAIRLLHNNIVDSTKTKKD